MCKEQSASIRKTLVPVRTGAARYDVPKVLTAILVRKDFILYLKTRFPKMSYLIDYYLSPEWHAKTFNFDDLKLTATSTSIHEEVCEVQPADQMLDQSDSAFLSSYSCHPLLKGLLERLMRNGYEPSMCRLANESVPGKHLLMTALDDSLNTELNKIADKYTVDFPATASVSDATQTWIHDPANTQPPLEVVTKRVLEDDKDYRVTLGEYNSLVARKPVCIQS